MDKDRRLWTAGLRKGLLALVLCPLSFVLAPAAQAVDVNLMVGERYPTDSSAYRSFTYSNGARWYKLSTATASGAVSDIVRAQFKNAHSTAGNLSNGSQTTTEFFFTATAPGDVTLTLYRCSASGDLVPKMDAEYAYRTYSGKSGDSNKWMPCDGQTYTFHVTKPAEPQPVELPTAQTLTYNGQQQICIDNSAGKFTLGGAYQATSVGTYTAKLTPAEGYYWADNSTGAKDLVWTIARKSATITAKSTSKVLGADDPVFTATVEGLVDGFQPTYTVERTDKSETLGTYTLYVTGEAEQGNYLFSYVNGKFTITDAVIEYTGTVEEKTVDGEEVYIFKSNGTLTLPADVVADILVVGGGGAGYARRSSNGGGGAGGAGVEEKNRPMPAGKYTIVVGKGGDAAQYSGSSTSGGNGGESSIGGVAGFEKIAKSGGAKGTTNDATAGFNTKSSITGEETTYGKPGATASSATNGGANTGNGGSGSKKANSGAGGSGVVIVRILRERTKIAVPTAATGLVWGMTNLVGVAAGEGYERGGTYEASAVGEYAATVTPDDDHCWSDLSRDTRTIKWSIARRPAKVTVLDATKAPNDPEPVFHTKNEGFLAADQAELVWTAWRTNTDETVGTYDVVILGEKEQGGYDITYVGNTLTIAEKPVGPSIPETEGEIEYDPETKEVVVTPKDETVTEVEIINMPADGTVKVPVSVGTIKGVEPGQVAEVFYTAPAVVGGKTYDITPAFTISGEKEGGVAIELDETASVTFDLGDGETETITVTPTLTETGDETVEPFEVATEEVDVGVKTIPGLTYALKRSDEPGTVSAGKVVNEKRAEGLRTKLTDPMAGGKPEKAFYIIKVRKGEKR